MLVRDTEANIVIVYRKDCKNEAVYNEKIYNIRLAYTKKYKSVMENPPKIASKINSQTYFSKNSADD
jgi:hypothetical protein